jgi:hypothetical protein
MGLVGVTFLLVVALLALAMTRMLEVDAKIYSDQILSLKAFCAAESGLNWVPIGFSANRGVCSAGDVEAWRTIQVRLKR